MDLSVGMASATGVGMWTLLSAQCENLFLVKIKLIILQVFLYNILHIKQTKMLIRVQRTLS